MEQTGARINIPPPSAQKDEITIAGEKEGVATAKETIMGTRSITENRIRTLSVTRFSNDSLDQVFTKTFG